METSAFPRERVQEDERELERLMRETPTPHTEALAVREAIERKTRERNPVGS